MPILSDEQARKINPEFGLGIPFDVHKCLITSKEPSIKKVRNIIADVGTRPEKEIGQLVLFRGNMSVMQAKARLSFVLSMMEANVCSYPCLAKIIKGSPNLLHLEGMHHPLGSLAVYGIFSRIALTPAICKIYPGLEDYVHSVDGIHLFPLTRIAEYSWDLHTRRAWRKIARPSQVQPRLTSFYPYIPAASAAAAAAAECDVLSAVHNIVPRTLPQNVRPDVCQDLIISILAGALTVDNLKSDSSWYIKELLKKHPSRYGDISLESVRGDRTLGQSLGIS